jgi:hypothetical protein
MTLEQCIADLIGIAQSQDLIDLMQTQKPHELKLALKKQMDIPIDAYLVGQNATTEREHLAREFRDRAPDTELVMPMLELLVFGPAESLTEHREVEEH